MADYKVVDAEKLDADLTGMADEVRTLADTDSKMSLEVMTDNVAQANEKVDSQSEIIAQIKTALQGKAISGIVEQEKTLTVTENGSYKVLPDKNKVLSGVSVEVNVPIGDPYEVMNSAIKGILTEFYSLESWDGYSAQTFGMLFNGQGNLVKWGMPNNTHNLGGHVFRYCSKLTYIDIGKPNGCNPALFYGRPLLGLTIIIRAETPPALGGTFSASGFDNTTKIFVPKDSLEAYKTATNWSTYADVFYAIEDYPEEVNYDNY